MAALASKQQSQKIFEKLKTKQANKVSPATILFPLYRFPDRSTHTYLHYRLPMQRKVFVVLQTGFRGSLCCAKDLPPTDTLLLVCRYALTADRRTRRGRPSRSESIFVSTAPRTIAISECTFPLCAPPTSIVSTVVSDARLSELRLGGFRPRGHSVTDMAALWMERMAMGPIARHESGWQ